MKALTYHITRGEHDSILEREEVTGILLFELYGYEWAAHKAFTLGGDSFQSSWLISEVSTGFELESGKIFSLIEEAKETWR